MPATIEATHPVTESSHSRTDHEPGSPFDAIRNIRNDGSEYWSARDLMPLLGYDSWRRFTDVIDRAQAAARNQGFTAGNLFLDTAVKNSDQHGTNRGRPANNVELTRFAAYLVAMNGDPRKSQIAAAQAYFAIRTRQAEAGQHQHQHQGPAPADDISAERKLALLEAAVGILGREQIRQRTARFLDETVGVPEPATDPAHRAKHRGTGIRNLEQFWHMARHRLVWDLVPFAFLWQLYQTWCAQTEPEAVLLSRQQFVSGLVTLVGEDGEWHCPDKRRKMRPRSMMDAPEPLIAEYGLNDPRDRINHRGLLRSRSLSRTGD
ncbi:BRO family protein [Arthrobacter castelli]|uniref:BRO family protein n=1 Tax=Arthrobacter castelli TaxID=271431 RepID=UPI00040AE674|nr:BRO family protein [Arthrobacter castelli]